MDFLREVELQLSRLVGIAEEHLKSPHDPCPRYSITSMVDALNRVDKLQDQLRSATHSIVSQAAQPNARTEMATESNDNSTLEEGEIAISDDETETEEEMDAEAGDGGVFEGDGKKPIRDEVNNEEKTRKKKATINVPALEKSLLKSIKAFSYFLKKLGEMNEKTDRKQLQKVMALMTRECGITMGKLSKFSSDGHIPSVDTAIRYRDAVIQLPDVVTRHQAQRSATKRWMRATIKNIAKLWAFAEQHSGLPPAFSDPQLLSTKKALQDHSAIYCSEYLQKMEAFMRSMKSRPSELEPNNIYVPLEMLASDFQRDFRLYARHQRSRRTPPRTQERWDLFTKIGETLTHWIQLAELASPPPKLPRNLSKFHGQLKTFDKQYPGRVPAELLRESVVLTKLAPPKIQRNPAKKIKMEPET